MPAEPPVVRLEFCLAPGVTLSRGEGGALVVEAPQGRLPLPHVGADAAAVLLALQDPAARGTRGGAGSSSGALEAWDVRGAHAPGPGHGASTESRQILELLATHQLLHALVTRNGAEVARLVPISPFYRLAAPPIRKDIDYKLSRFCYARAADRGGLLVECPLAHAHVRLTDRAAAGLLHELSRPRSPVDLASHLPELSQEEIVALLSLLLAAGLASECDAEGAARIDASPALDPWCFHDLLFHARSRRGRHDNPIGATYRFRGRMAPRPAVKPPVSAVRLPLFRPDMASLWMYDAPLTRVLEERVSVRANAPIPLTVHQLGELLYRVARVRTRVVHDDVELTSRPYPSGGASYELELYLNVDRCVGLERGLYHYDPVGHTLGPISGPTEETERQLAEAWHSTARLCHPEVLVTITARFQRVSWKYESMAYATILKDVGALYQTMYLVATAMGLGPCALGCGDSDRFSRMIAEDYYAESSVGEFILGSRDAGTLHSHWQRPATRP